MEFRERSRSRERVGVYSSSSSSTSSSSTSLSDPNLIELKDDPRIKSVGGGGGGDALTKLGRKGGGGRNTESFDPRSTLIRPQMRVRIGPNRAVLGDEIKHDDIIIVPGKFPLKTLTYPPHFFFI